MTTSQQFTISRAAISSAYHLLRVFGLSQRPLEELVDEITAEIDRVCVDSSKTYGGLREYLDVRDGDIVHYALRAHFAERSLVAIITDEIRPTVHSGTNGKIVIALIAYSTAHRNITDGAWRSMDEEAIFPAISRPAIVPMTGLESEPEVVALQQS